MNYIIFTNEIEKELEERLREFNLQDVFILVDNNTQKYCLSFFENLGFKEENIIVIQEGEQHKSLESVSKIWSVLSHNKAKRNSVLINIGGGLITDIGGFAASCFKRGISHINIPTTLLAQVDASVGGKTGINFCGFKNEIGTFAIPEYVFIDNRFLATLSKRQIMSGFAEMLKHALLADEDQLAEIMNVDLECITSDVFLQYIKESVAVKEAIVRTDPKEKGIRKALNFGHTVGHAIESAAISRQEEIYHGDAIAYGMVAELYLSVKKLGFDERHYKAILNFIRDEYPVYHASAGKDELYELMLHDKKNERNGVNFTLLRDFGEFDLDNYCSKDEVLEALSQLEEL